MCNCTKIWLVIAAILILTGSAVFAIKMNELKWDFKKLSTTEYETSTYPISQNLKSISIATDTADIVFVPSENGSSSVTCYEQAQVKHTVSVKDDTLVIQVVDTRKWYEHIGIHWGTPKITVYLPQGTYGALSIASDTGNVEIADAFQFASMEITESTGNVTSFASVSDRVKIRTSTGNIRVENISAGAMALTVSTGSVTVSGVTCRSDLSVGVSTGKTVLTDIRCGNLVSTGSTGKISLEKVTATEKLSIQRSTGDVRFDRSDAAEVLVETDTGDVTGSLLTPKVFVVKSNTGRIDIPKTASGGICDITTETGNVTIRIAD